MARSPRLPNETPEARAKRKALLERDLEHNQRGLEGVMNDRNRSPKMLYGLIAAPVLGYFMGPYGGVGVVVVVLSFFLGTIYITAIRADEYRGLIADDERELRRIAEAEAAADA